MSTESVNTKPAPGKITELANRSIQNLGAGNMDQALEHLTSKHKAPVLPKTKKFYAFFWIKASCFIYISDAINNELFTLTHD
jgi:hypothetical protein